MRCWVIVAVCVGVAGCGDDSASSADAAPRSDADPSVPVVQEFQPRSLFEGEGCVPDGSGGCDAAHGVPIVFVGNHFASDATLVITIDDVDTTAPLTVSGDGTMAAAVIRAPVFSDLRQSEMRQLVLNVTQGDKSAGAVLQIHGLDELDDMLIDDPASVDTALDLQLLYSRIDLDKPLQFIGHRNVRLAATSEVVVSSDLVASATGSSSGPGGCNPPVVCAGAGEPGSAGGGGGGGGHAELGAAGTAVGAAFAGAGGVAVGDPTLTPMAGFAAESVHGAFGGAGGSVGTGESVIPGGAGGGGGGVVEITSFGSLTLGSGLSIVADGGDGAPGAGTPCVDGQHSGGGGGGSGGAILLRAHRVLVDEGVGDALSVAGGAGGVLQAGCSNGGGGAVGRIRIDSPVDGPLPAITGTVVPFRGPIIDPATPVIASTTSLALDILGGDGVTYFIELVGSEQPQQEVTVSANQRVTATLELEPGLNQICVKVAGEVSTAQPEGLNCRSIAVILP